MCQKKFTQSRDLRQSKSHGLQSFVFPSNPASETAPRSLASTGIDGLIVKRPIYGTVLGKGRELPVMVSKVYGDARGIID